MQGYTILSMETAGANCTISNIPTDNKSNVVVQCKKYMDSDELPQDLTEISDSSLACIIVYCIVFVLAGTGNLKVCSTLWRKCKRSQSRITLLLLNMAVADMIVCCTVIPAEVFWRLTVQWWGGNLLCKVTQFMSAFGLYLSSLVLICVSVDRYLAIMFPIAMLKVGTYQGAKIMLAIAWITAVIFSTPQLLFFSVETHPDFPSFKQCVTNDVLAISNSVKVYSIFSVVAMYFVPLFVIIFTYSSIVCKLSRKAKGSTVECDSTIPRIIYSGCQADSVESNSQVQSESISSSSYPLRCTSNAESNLSKAKKRTLLMTIVMVSVFIVCWSPYAFITLWYMVDWNGAAELDYRVQDALFLMAVANSCVNPLIHGVFNYNRGARITDRSSMYS